MTEHIFTPAELARVHALHAPTYWNAALETPIWLAVLLLFLGFGVRPLYAAGERMADALGRAFPRAVEGPGLGVIVRALNRLWGGPGWGRAILFANLSAVVLFACQVPGNVFFEYLLPHRHGLARMTALQYLRDTLDDLVLTLVLSACLTVGVFGLIRRLPRWWLVLGSVSAGLLLVSATLDPYRSRLEFEQTPLPPGALRDTLKKAMDRAGIQVADIVVEKTSWYSKKVQAFFAGQGPSRKIILNDALVAEMAPNEVLAVVAHEAGHVKESRWTGRLLSALALIGFLFLVDRVFRFAVERRWFGASERGDIRVLPLMTFVFFVVMSIATPISAVMSREREAAADHFALELTRDPASFRSMLVKATRVNLMDPDPPRWVVLLGSDHPPISERIRATEAFH